MERGEKEEYEAGRVEQRDGEEERTRRVKRGEMGDKDEERVKEERGRVRQRGGGEERSRRGEGGRRNGG